MIFFTGCTHFNHDKIIKYCERPYPDVGTMERDMIWKWNKKVSDDDTVYHLGDFGYGSPRILKIFLEHLNGHKILIKGNHDRKGLRVFRNIGFDEVSKKTRRLWSKYFGVILLSHRPVKDESKFSGVTWNFHSHTHQKNVLNGNRVHVGVESWNFEPVSELEILEYLIGKGYLK